ncbi:MAG: type II toxin-antitoxin system HicA family toxin [Ruminococcaceae bacterium]|nr:type II toxin-antitoxin system HicA family toxin [Oscillospiraceae bacterium]MBQ2916501.1 type II toxin-antitoxin system HicA family toxin [Clostridia bacterium]
MSKWEKLLSRIKNLDKNMRFAELKKILESYGYEMRSPSGGSSHCTFRKKGRNPITIPMHEPIKTVYILMVKEIIEMEENNENS